LQETPALSGSGARRGGKTRRDIYDIEPSPVPTYTAMLDESLVQEEISANEDSNMFNGIGGDSFAGLEDTTAAAYDMDGSMDAAEPYVEEFVPKPAKRGRKRKSDTLDEVVERDSPAPLPKKGRTTTTKASATVKGKKTVQPAKSKPGRAAKPKRFSEIIEDDSSVAEANPTDESIQEEEEPIKAPAKGRGRPPKASVDTSIDESVQDPPVRGRGRPSKKTVSKDSPGKENRDSSVFKKPAPKSKAKPKPSPLSNTEPVGTGRLVDAAGKPLSKDQIDQMSTASTGSRFGRGRQLSVFREFGAEQFGRVGRTGRHHLPPVNFWAGEQVNYDKDGSLVAVYQPEAWDEPPKKKAGAGKKKGGKRGRAADDDDEDDTLEEWETKDGVFGGIYRDFDAATETMLDDHLEGRKSPPHFDFAILSSTQQSLGQRKASSQTPSRASNSNFASFQQLAIPASSAGAPLSWRRTALSVQRIRGRCRWCSML
jgi:centromere protein C